MRGVHETGRSPRIVRDDCTTARKLCHRQEAGPGAGELRNLAQRVAGTGISQLNDWVAQMNEGLPAKARPAKAPKHHLNTT